jgi:GH24 family phage-related lysozyme (muramidase)
MPAKPDLSTALRYAATCVYGTEGFRDTAWLDTLPDPPVWTIGHGTTFIDDEPVSPGMICTRAQPTTGRRRQCGDRRRSARRSQR